MRFAFLFAATGLTLWIVTLRALPARVGLGITNAIHLLLLGVRVAIRNGVHIGASAQGREMNRREIPADMSERFAIVIACETLARMAFDRARGVSTAFTA